MRSNTKILVAIVAVGALWSMDVPDQGPLRLRWVREAHAIIGAPMTPLSAAGVARRTAYRSVEYSAAAAAAAAPKPAPAPAPAPAPTPASAGAGPAVGSIVTTLPPGCSETTLNGVAYQRCGSTYYKASFMGPNLVFVVAQP